MSLSRILLYTGMHRYFYLHHESFQWVRSGTVQLLHSSSGKGLKIESPKTDQMSICDATRLSLAEPPIHTQEQKGRNAFLKTVRMLRRHGERSSSEPFRSICCAIVRSQTDHFAAPGDWISCCETGLQTQQSGRRSPPPITQEWARNCAFCSCRSNEPCASLVLFPCLRPTGKAAGTSKLAQGYGWMSFHVVLENSRKGLFNFSKYIIRRERLFVCSWKI